MDVVSVEHLFHRANRVQNGHYSLHSTLRPYFETRRKRVQGSVSEAIDAATPFSARSSENKPISMKGVASAHEPNAGGQPSIVRNSNALKE